MRMLRCKKIFPPSHRTVTSAKLSAPFSNNQRMESCIAFVASPSPCKLASPEGNSKASRTPSKRSKGTCSCKYSGNANIGGRWSFKTNDIRHGATKACGPMPLAASMGTTINFTLRSCEQSRLVLIPLMGPWSDAETLSRLESCASALLHGSLLARNAHNGATTRSFNSDHKLHGTALPSAISPNFRACAKTSSKFGRLYPGNAGKPLGHNGKLVQQRNGSSGSDLKTSSPKHNNRREP
mmetsp:Transcript_248/g.532  ORF Transcript_248/g.532 Transcript_248/m.532 type:complete len:239 (+) Transcript_248:410-1126(+)